MEEATRERENTCGKGSEGGSTAKNQRGKRKRGERKREEEGKIKNKKNNNL